MKVSILVMYKRMGKQKQKQYRKDIQILTIKFCDPWCHGTSDIIDTGVKEHRTLMPQVFIDMF